jgi:WD40 repeat protein
VWDARRGTRTARCPLDSRTYSVALDSTHLLAAGADDGTVSLFDVRSCKKPRAVLRGHEGEVFATAFSRDGSLLVTGSADHRAIVWDVASRSKRAVLRGHADEVVSARFSPDGEFVVTKGGDGTYRVWDATTGERIERGPLTYAASGLAAVTFERSSSRLLMTDQQFVYEIPCAACAPVDELLDRAQARRKQLG